MDKKFSNATNYWDIQSKNVIDINFVLCSCYEQQFIVINDNNLLDQDYRKQDNREQKININFPPYFVK